MIASCVPPAPSKRHSPYAARRLNLERKNAGNRREDDTPRDPCSDPGDSRPRTRWPDRRARGYWPVLHRSEAQQRHCRSLCNADQDDPRGGLLSDIGDGDAVSRQAAWPPGIRPREGSLRRSRHSPRGRHRRDERACRHLLAPPSVSGNRAAPRHRRVRCDRDASRRQGGRRRCFRAVPARAETPPSAFPGARTGPGDP